MTRNRVYQFASIATTATFLLAIVGFPLPESRPKGDEDFPCRDHGCGCTTALMCRTACCCVRPAAKAVASSAKSSGGCCSAKEAVEQTDQEGVGWAIGASACQGINGTWTSLGVSIPPAGERLVYGLTKQSMLELPSNHFLTPLSIILIEPPPPRFSAS